MAASSEQQAPCETEPTVPARTPDAAFGGFVVAVGASAGGLEALERLFGALPVDSGAAFVVVQHLSPDHKSMMDNLLARYTAMPVRVAGHDMALQPNAVFLIPPGKHMRLAHDRLQLAPKPDHGLSLPIDIFFNSLAEQCSDRGIAVVLSGTGSDGSRGLAALNAAGGFTFVQDPTTAKFDGMPRSAIATGLVDVVAPAEVLAQRLAEHLRAPRSETLRLLGGDALPVAIQPLDGIMETLLASSGIDFREYKPTTVLRRIERRMQVLHAGSLADYLERLSGSSDEQSLLRRELLIPVTHFFRDGELFEFLAEEVIPALVQRSGIEPIRVWVACCATGEEAYSVAILFAEAFRRIGRSRPVKIFATDVEQQYLDQAGSAVYPDTIAAEVSAERLASFFHERLGAYTVTPEVRQMVIFARHNLVADPPFTRMDLVTCRNALIYFQPRAQERALRRLQYALATAGHLVLGPSESLGILHRDFRPLASRHKVYQVLRRDRMAITLDGSGRHRGMAGRAVIRASVPAPDPQAARVDNGQALLMQSYVPPSLLVSDTRELLHVYGDARRLLQIAEGQATLDVLKLLPRELGWAAGLALQAALEERSPQRSPPLRLPDSAHPVQLVARPLEASDGQRLVLLSVEPMPGDGPVPDTSRQADDGAAHQRRIEVLERELSLTHDSLQTTIEALETANEELQATNEELMASNEELQSTNEELQSVNEELYTVNSEYQEKVDILNSVNADLENVSRAAAIPTLFVDDALHLTRFTPEASMLFKVREGDAGRSIEDFAHQLDYPDLFVDLRRTLHTGVAAEREVQSRNGDWWVGRIQPYKGRTLGGTTRAVMTFFNVTSLKDSQRLQAVIDSLSEHLAVVDPQGCITMVNTAWRRYAADNGDAELRHSGPGSNYLQVCAQSAPVDDYARRAHEGLSAVLEGRQSVFRMQYPCLSKGRQLWFLMHAAPVAHRAGGAVVSHIDVTLWVEGTAVPDTMAPGAEGSKSE